MAEIRHIIGAILQDIAQARFSSDIYSRDISRYYEQDALLRRFPVPRSDIEEVDIELKFAFDKVEVDPARREGGEALTSPVFSRFSYNLAAHFFDTLFRVLAPETPDPDIPVEADLSDDVQRRIHLGGSRIYLHQDILHYLGENRGNLIHQGRLDEGAAREGLQRTILKMWGYLFEESGLPDEKMQKLQDKVFEEMNLQAQVRALQERVQPSLRMSQDYKVDIHVTNDILQATPEPAISTLKVKVAMRNYLWSQVDERDGRAWRSLSPE